MTNSNEEAARVARVVRVAAVGDIHCTAASRGSFQRLFRQISESADVLALCGDLTQAGRVEEARVLADDIASSLSIPALAVWGNHDVEAGQLAELRRILNDVGVRVLDGEACEVAGIGFAGVKGFGGGFHGKILMGWGESSIKQFVREAVEEAKRLEAALGQLRTSRRIALLHYSPLRATVVGESPEIFAFVGSSHLEAPLNRYAVRAAFHGHAHHGTPVGYSGTGVPVYNVSYPLMRQVDAARPFRVVEVPLAPPAALAGAGLSHENIGVPAAISHSR